jgi:hypothetical protein
MIELLNYLHDDVAFFEQTLGTPIGDIYYLNEKIQNIRMVLSLLCAFSNCTVRKLRGVFDIGWQDC